MWLIVIVRKEFGKREGGVGRGRFILESDTGVI